MWNVRQKYFIHSHRSTKVDKRKACYSQELGASLLPVLQHQNRRGSLASWPQTCQFTSHQGAKPSTQGLTCPAVLRWLCGFLRATFYRASENVAPTHTEIQDLTLAPFHLSVARLETLGLGMVGSTLLSFRPLLWSLGLREFFPEHPV